MSEVRVSTGGISLPMVLFLIFLVLKLCGVIAWSWWWVTAPLWIPFAFTGVFLIGAGLMAAVACIIAGVLAL